MEIGAAMAAVLVAAINMLGSVLLAWIKARYGSTETHNGINGKDLGQWPKTSNSLTQESSPTSRTQP